MSDQLIHQAAKLMREQAAAYLRLESASAQLTAALINGSAAAIESLTRAGESELLKMRARLVQIVATLGAFADSRAETASPAPISPEARTAFETSSKELHQAARNFQRTQKQATALATGGATFAAACIESCGAQPTTYSAPYARRGEAARWA